MSVTKRQSLYQNETTLARYLLQPLAHAIHHLSMYGLIYHFDQPLVLRYSDKYSMTFVYAGK